MLTKEEILNLSGEELQKKIRETCVFEPVQISFNSIPQGAPGGSPDEPIFDIVLDVPVTCKGLAYDPENPPIPTHWHQGCTLRVGLWTGMWQLAEGQRHPVKVLVRDEYSDELKR